MQVVAADWNRLADAAAPSQGTAAPTDPLVVRAEGALVFAIVGDAMGTPTENLEPDEIEARFGRVERFEGTGTDDTILRDLLIAALVDTDGRADADSWARQWRAQDRAIFGDKVGKFFQSVLHTATKLRYGWEPRRVGEGNMPSSSSAMAISPIGIVNAGHPGAAAAQAFEVASLIHGGEVGFCQDGAAAIAAAVATAMTPGATAEDAVAAARDAVRPWSGATMRGLIDDVLALAEDEGDERAFRAAFHARFRQTISCDSRETVPATLGLVRIGQGDPWATCVMAANFGRDTDTIAAMAGGITGALAGSQGLARPELGDLDPTARALQRAQAEALVAVGRAKAQAELASWRRVLAQPE